MATFLKLNRRRMQFYASAILLLFIWCIQQRKLSWVETASQNIYSALLRSKGVNGTQDEVDSMSCDNFEDVQTLPIMDECVLRYIREQLLTPPSTLNYSRSAMGDPYSSREELKPLFANKTNGFFIECGANDGVYHSNTLYLEKDQNWTGLLIEAQPQVQKKLLTQHRKAWVVNACLSPYNNISKINFLERDTKTATWHDAIGKLAMDDDKTRRKFKDWGFREFGSVPCFPLVSILAAMNVTQVDFLSLDVEGVEMKILKTLPFDESLTIDVIQAEVKHIPEGKKAVTAFLLSKGYEVFAKYTTDLIFKRVAM